MRVHAVIGLSLSVASTWILSAGIATAQSPQLPQRIAYDTCYAWDYTVYCEIVVSIDGSVTTAVSGGVQPRWSPDGTRLAFVGGPYDSPADIYVVSLEDPTAVTNITNSPATNGPPEWSRDGKIAFASNRSGATELYVVNADGTNLLRLTNSIGFSGRHAWSPDGKVIALTAYPASGWDLYTIRADGSNLMRLASSNGPSDRLSWSPDGSRIVFDCATAVCTINADGTGLTQVTTGTSMGGVFAPAGGNLAFDTVVFGDWAIAVKRSDGAVASVGPSPPGVRLVWSPDGETLLYQGTEIVAYSGICYFGGGAHNADDFCIPQTGIYAANADGTGPVLFAVGSSPDWFIPRAGQPVASFTDACSGSSCLFDASGSRDPEGALVSYRWQFGDGASGTGENPSHVYATGGAYSVTLTIVDAEGLQSTTSRRVMANAPPIASFTVVCSGPTCSFDGSASSDPDGTLVSLEWQFGDGATSSGKTATHIYANGTFVAQFTVQDNAGVRSTASRTLQIVNALPVASFSAACYAFTCTFNASASRDPDGTIRDFLWHFGDGSAEYSPAITAHTYWAAGTYVVSLMVIDDAGQKSTRDQTVTIVPGSMHIGDLDGSSQRINAKWWEAGAIVTVHDANHVLLANATVTALFSTGEIASCTSDAGGRCRLTAWEPPTKMSNLSITIQSITRLGYVYQPASNHDPDGDSNGTTLRVSR